MTIAERPANGPVIRSCPYGGWENPTTKSHPTTPSGIAASGSEINDKTATTAAVTISTAVGETRPCRAAATVPRAKSSPKPVTRANGAANPRCLELLSLELLISCGVKRRMRGKLMILIHP